jgi:lipoate-protein ligase A
MSAQNMRQYRLLIDRPTLGLWNMSVDEAIMNDVINGLSAPTIRFYAWQPATLSLGYAQPSSDADLIRIQDRGWNLVRRVTGGRAILHHHELTYSVIVPENHPLAQLGIIESYRQISLAITHGLELLGLQTQADRKEGSLKDMGAVCFETPSHYEITTQDGRKLVGSAQLRRRGAILQHGTLPLYGDVSDICDALVYPDAKARDLSKISVRKRAATLQDALGVIVDWEDAVQAMVSGFQSVFDADLVQDCLTPHEQTEVERLARDVYGHDEWTFRR